MELEVDEVVELSVVDEEEDMSVMPPLASEEKEPPPSGVRQADMVKASESQPCSVMTVDA